MAASGGFFDKNSKSNDKTLVLSSSVATKSDDLNIDLNSSDECALDTQIVIKDILSIVFGYVETGVAYNKNVSFFNNFKSRIALIAKQVTDYVLWGVPEMAIAMSQEHPETLLQMIKTKNGPNNIPLEATPYQALLWTDDNHIRNDEGSTFLEMMRQIFIDKYGVKAEEKQRDGWFKDWDDKAHVLELKTEFDKVVEVFDKTKATTDDELAKDEKLQSAIQAFRHYLRHVITRKNCIRELWDHAAVFYQNKKFEDYGGWGELFEGSAKNNLFCQKILGSIDRYLPAWAMQVLRCEGGIIHVVSDRVNVLRTKVSTSYSATPNNSGMGIYVLGQNSFIGLNTGDVVDSALERSIVEHAPFQSFVNQQRDRIVRSATIRSNVGIPKISTTLRPYP